MPTQDVRSYADVQKEDMSIKRAGLAVSIASLAVSVAALCLNEKPESKNTFKNKGKKDDKMNQTQTVKTGTDMKQEKQRAREIKKAKKVTKARVENQIKAKAVELGYTGTVIVLNTKDGEKRYRLTPIENKKKTPVKKKVTPKVDNRSWVAMEINARTGNGRQAIVCGSMDEAKRKATAMKRAHRSPQSPFIQGYALMDTSKGIDVGKWMLDKHDGRLYRV